jgi:hypothetical protein
MVFLLLVPTTAVEVVLPRQTKGRSSPTLDCPVVDRSATGQYSMDWLETEWTEHQFRGLRTNRQTYSAVLPS